MESKGMKMYVIRKGYTFADEVNLAKITPAILFTEILENSPEKSSKKETKIYSDKKKTRIYIWWWKHTRKQQKVYTSAWKYLLQ